MNHFQEVITWFDAIIMENKSNMPTENPWRPSWTFAYLTYFRSSNFLALLVCYTGHFLEDLCGQTHSVPFVPLSPPAIVSQNISEMLFFSAAWECAQTQQKNK